MVIKKMHEAVVAIQEDGRVVIWVRKGNNGTVVMNIPDFINWLDTLGEKIEA